MSNMGRRRRPSASAPSAKETRLPAARHGQHYTTDIVVDAGCRAAGMVRHRWAKDVRLFSVSK